ncbi:MAG: hypothetical protein Kow0058_12400 [Roseovarius sp.]
MLIGTAGLSLFCGTEPVIATQMMHGFDMRAPLASAPSLQQSLRSATAPARQGARAGPRGLARGARIWPQSRPRSASTLRATRKHSSPCGTPQ